jgi:MFS superfamily sulfate permease-like transporter
VSPTLAWVLLVAALWGVIGLVRGVLQPPAWPILYVTKRWLIRLAIWGAILVLAGYGLAVWWQRSFGQAGDTPGQLRVQAALIGVFLAAIPAAIAALRRPRATPSKQPAAASFASTSELLPNGVPSWPREHARGLAWGAVAVVVLILVLAFAPRLARTEWAEVRAQEEVVASQGWAETQWIRLNTAIDDAVNRYYLRRYDRRAPIEPTPAKSPTPKASPTPRVTPAPTGAGG